MKNKRIDLITASHVDMAIKIRGLKGKLAAARYLDKNQVPVAVSMRVLGIEGGERREVVSDTSVVDRRQTPKL